MRMNLRNSSSKNLFLTLMLIVAMALTVAGCGNKTPGIGNSQPSQVETPGDDTNQSSQSETPNTGTDQQASGDSGESTVLGEGKTVIYFVVVDLEGNETKFEIHTDKKMVGEALLEHELISGDDSQYGLYVKNVNGITADYDVDQTYWAFYVCGEYATSGVDTTPVTEGETYAFKIEK